MRGFRNIVEGAFGIILATVVFVEIIYVFYGLLYYPHNIMLKGSLPIYLVAPLPTPIIILGSIGGGALLAYVLAGSVIVSSSASYSFFGSSEIRRTLAKYFGVIALFAMLESLVRVSSGKLPPDIGALPHWESWMYLLNASFYEEVITRSLIIGLPAALLSIKEKGWYRLILGKFPKDYSGPLTWVLVALSALAFGYAHVPSWGPLKLLSAVPAGVMLGLAFVRFGLWASIALHFSVDFLGALVAGPYSSLLAIPAALLLMLFAIYGVYALVAWSVARPRREAPRRRAKMAVRACPHCGGTVFEYVGPNLYRCVTCGALLREEDLVIKEIEVE